MFNFTPVQKRTVAAAVTVLAFSLIVAFVNAAHVHVPGEAYGCAANLAAAFRLVLNTRNWLADK